MDADLELLLTVVYCITDDFLPKRAANPRRQITDAELITLCIAQAIMGIPSDPRFLAVAHRTQHAHERCYSNSAGNENQVPFIGMQVV